MYPFRNNKGVQVEESTVYPCSQNQSLKQPGVAVFQARVELGSSCFAPASSPVGGAADAEGGGLAGEVVAVAGGRDGVEADAVGDLLALGVDLGAGGDDTVGLALPEGHVPTVIDDDVAGLTGGVGADDALDGGHLAGVGRLVLEGVHRGLQQGSQPTTAQRLATASGEWITELKLDNRIGEVSVLAEKQDGDGLLPRALDSAWLEITEHSKRGIC